MTLERFPSLPCLLLALFAAACGGGGAKESNSPASGSEGPPSSASSSPADTTDAPAMSDAEQVESFSGFSCGQGSCPSGAYCDESRASLAACAWMSDCGAEPSCGCLTRILGAACSCEFEGGGPRVRCSE